MNGKLLLIAWMVRYNWTLVELKFARFHESGSEIYGYNWTLVELKFARLHESGSEIYGYNWTLVELKFNQILL